MSDWYDQRLKSNANAIAKHRARAEYRRANATVRIANAQERIATALEQIAANGTEISTEALAVIAASAEAAA